MVRSASPLTVIFVVNLVNKWEIDDLVQKRSPDFFQLLHTFKALLIDTCLVIVMWRLSVGRVIKISITRILHCRLVSAEEHRCTSAAAKLLIRKRWMREGAEINPYNATDWKLMPFSVYMRPLEDAFQDRSGKLSLLIATSKSGFRRVYVGHKASRRVVGCLLWENWY